MASTNVTTAYVLATLRNALAEQNSTGRWTDPLLLNWVDRAHKALVKRVLWPSTTNLISLQNGIATYDMSSDTFFPAGIPLRILRITVGGQVLVPTTIDIMEGTQTDTFDDSFTPTMGTQWEAQTPQTYPVITNSGDGPIPQTIWSANNGLQRPRYYIQGPLLGIIPTPSGTPLARIWNVPSPVTLTNGASETLLFPDIATDYVVAKALEFAYRSDGDNDTANNQRSIAKEEESEVREWIQGLQGDFGERPHPWTYRNGFQGGRPYQRGGW